MASSHPSDLAGASVAEASNTEQIARLPRAGMLEKDGLVGIWSLYGTPGPQALGQESAHLA